jgi:hypothetical protein
MSSILADNIALVYEPKCVWGGGGGCVGLSQWVQLCTWNPKKLWRSITPNLTYDVKPLNDENILWLPESVEYDVYKYTYL